LSIRIEIRLDAQRIPADEPEMSQENRPAEKAILRAQKRWGEEYIVGRIADLFPRNENIAEEFVQFACDELESAQGAVEEYEAVLQAMQGFAAAFCQDLGPFREWLKAVECVEAIYAIEDSNEGPISSRFFAYWSLSDLRFGPDGETIALVLHQLLLGLPKEPQTERVQMLVANIAASRLGLYDVMFAPPDAHLRELFSREIVRCRTEWGHKAKRRELWFSRLAPDPGEERVMVTLTRPCVLTERWTHEWSMALLDLLDSQEPEGLVELMKYGREDLCWLEYLSQAWVRSTDQATFLRGALEAKSRPNSKGQNLEPRYQAFVADEPYIDLSLTLARRKLIGALLPPVRERLFLSTSSRKEVTISLTHAQVLFNLLPRYSRGLKGARLTTATDLYNELDRLLAQTYSVPPNWTDSETTKDYLLRFELQDTDLLVRRFVRVPVTTSLAELHHLLQIVFQWEDRHLHDFTVKGRRYSDLRFGLDDTLCEDVPLCGLCVRGDRFLYNYDFGDDWRVSVEVIRDYDWTEHIPRFIGGLGPAPPEDCGGIPGFEGMADGLYFDADAMMVQLHCDAVGVAPEDIQETVLLVQRRETNGLFVKDRPVDLVIVIEANDDVMLAAKTLDQGDGYDVVLEAVREALDRVEERPCLVVDDKSLKRHLEREFGLEVQLHRAIPELSHFFHILEAKLAGVPYSFSGISRSVLQEFLETATSFYLEAPWFEFDDDQFFLVEGVTPTPIVLSVLGASGVQYGLAVFEDPLEADLLFEDDDQPLLSSSYVCYAEEFEGGRLRQDLVALALSCLDDVVPYILTPQGTGGERHYRLLKLALDLVMTFRTAEAGVKKMKSSDGQVTATVRWPVSRYELRRMTFAPKSKTKLGRNDPCWCGSGKKYKKCHFGRD
jgi:Plasmid pRiA4b ORF-3-like protein/SEC-C motif